MDNVTIIDTIVKYSKDCIAMRFIKNHLYKSWLLVKSLPIAFRLPSADTIKIVIDELDMRIDEREQDIGKYLEPLFEGNDFGHKTSKKHSLTLKEIKDGYIILGGEKYIILLRKFISPNSGFTFEPGVLYKIGSGISEKDITDIKPSEREVLKNELLNIVIKKKTAYEYLE